MIDNIDWFSLVFGGVVIGFIVNIAAFFAIPKIEHWWGKYNSSRRIKNEEKKRAFDEKVEYLVNNKHEELLANLKQSSLLSYNILMLLAGFGPLIFLRLFEFPQEIEFIVCLSFFVVGTTKAIIGTKERNDLVEILNAVDKKLDRRKL